MGDNIPGNVTRGSLCASSNFTANRHILGFRCEPDVSGRVVRVSSRSDAALHICELRILGVRTGMTGSGIPNIFYLFRDPYYPNIIFLKTPCFSNNSLINIVCVL